MTTAHPSATRTGTQRPLGLVATLAVIATLTPCALLLVPGVGQFLASVLDVSSMSQVETSYTPEAPLIFYSTSGEAVMIFSVVVGGLALSMALAGCALGFATLHVLVKSRRLRDALARTLVFATIAVFAITLTTAVLHARGNVTEGTRDAQVAQWVEGRYGLTVDSATAEALVEHSGPEGDPVLVEDRLLHLTRVAQGGYVLTEDGSAVELPTTDMEGDS